MADTKTTEQQTTPAADLEQAPVAQAEQVKVKGYNQLTGEFVV